MIALLLGFTITAQSQNVVQTKAQWTKSMDSIANVAANAAVARIQGSLFAISPATAQSLTKYDSTLNALKNADSTIKSDVAKVATSVTDGKKIIDGIEQWRLTAITDIKKAIETGTSNTSLLKEHDAWIDDKQVQFNKLFKP